MKNPISQLVSAVQALIVVSTITLLPFVSTAQIKFKVESPLNAGSIEELITSILGILIVIATPIVVLFIIYAGFLYVTAQGNAEQVKTATRALTYAIIGGVLIIGAVALSGIIEGVVTAFKAP